MLSSIQFRSRRVCWVCWILLISSLIQLLAREIGSIVAAEAARTGRTGTGGPCTSELRRSLNVGPDTGPEELVHKVDQMIQIHAFKALLRPRTGTIYDVPLPIPLQPGLSVQAVRLKSGSLQHRGFIFNEFILPPRLGVTSLATGLQPEYVVLVYRFFAMRFSAYCPKNGLSIVGPVVGIRAYSGMVMSISEPDEVEIVALEDPITARIPIFPMSDSKNTAMCALFDGNGNSTVTPMTYVNVCSMYQLGDATLVNLAPEGNQDAPGPLQQQQPPQAPSPSPTSNRSNPLESSARAPKNKNKNAEGRLKIGLLIAVALIVLCIGTVLLAGAGWTTRQASRISRMEIRAADGPTLGSTLIAHNSRPPSAIASRTRPVLERDYIFR